MLLGCFFLIIIYCCNNDSGTKKNTTETLCRPLPYLIINLNNKKRKTTYFLQQSSQHSLTFRQFTFLPISTLFKFPVPLFCTKPWPSFGADPAPCTTCSLLPTFCSCTPSLPLSSSPSPSSSRPVLEVPSPWHEHSLSLLSPHVILSLQVILAVRGILHPSQWKPAKRCKTEWAKQSSWLRKSWL